MNPEESPSLFFSIGLGKVNKNIYFHCRTDTEGPAAVRAKATHIVVRAARRDVESGHDWRFRLDNGPSVSAWHTSWVVNMSVISK